MNQKLWLKILFSILVIGALIAAGVWIFNMGVVRGAALQGDLSTFSGRAFMPYGGMMRGYDQDFGGYAYHMQPFGMHRFFSPFHFLGGLFIFFLVLAFFRVVFSGRWAGRGHYHGFHGCGLHTSPGEDEIPPMVEKWHKKMHEQDASGEK